MYVILWGRGVIMYSIRGLVWPLSSLLKIYYEPLTSLNLPPPSEGAFFDINLRLRCLQQQHMYSRHRVNNHII